MILTKYCQRSDDQVFHVLNKGTVRKTVYPDDILSFHEEWVTLIRENAPKVLEVEQSLIELIPVKTWNEFVNAVHNPSQMR